MSSPMHARLFARLLAIALLGVGLSASGCNLFGTDNSDVPEWVGNWEVTSLDGEAPDRPRFWSITQETWDIVEETAAGNCAMVDEGTITSRADNVVTVDFQNEGTLQLRLTVSGDSLASTLTEEHEGSDDVVAAEEVEFNPLNRLGC